VRAAHKLDAHAIEIHTGRYAEARASASAATSSRASATPPSSVRSWAWASPRATACTTRTRRWLIAEIEELNIGHSIVARALMTGMERAVRDMLDLMREARADMVKSAR
jgi:pyridoxine 5-phosphate synthase